MLRKPGYKKFWNVAPVHGKAAAGGSFALTYQDNKTSASGATPITYSGFTLAGGATRTIAVIQWYGGASPAISSMTINGVACTQVSGALATIGSDQNTDIWISNSAVTGGTVNVVITYASNTTYYSAVALYNLTTSTTAASAAVNSTPSFGVTSDSVGPISIPSGGGAVFGSFAYSGATETFTSGNVTIDATVVPTAGATFYFGHTTATGSQTVSFNLSSGDRPYSSIAAWGP